MLPEAIIEGPPAKFNLGNVLRYNPGSTALMEVTSVRLVGGAWRYYGEQYFGGIVGAYEGSCQTASVDEISAWPTRWDCNEVGCTERTGLAGSGRCPTHAREDIAKTGRPTDTGLWWGRFKCDLEFSPMKVWTGTDHKLWVSHPHDHNGSMAPIDPSTMIWGPGRVVCPGGRSASNDQFAEDLREA